MELVTSLLMIITGVFVGIIGTTVGGSSFITIPFLMILGLNPYVAIATNKISILGSFITGGVKYYKEGVIKYEKLILILIIAASLGSVIGANLVLKIDEYILKIIIIILLIISLLITLTKNKLGSNSLKIKLTKQKYVTSFIVIFLLGIYSGFFGAGFGTFIIFSLIYFFGLTFLEGAAFMTIINLFVIVVAVIIFAYNNIIDYSIGIPLLIGTTIGGWLGARLAILKGNIWIKKFFILITFILIIKLIFTL